MNAFNKVNLAASCIITSAAYATELGIPESRWIYSLGGAGTQDSDKCKLILHESSLHHLMACFTVWQRPNFHSSPSISRSIDACLDAAGLRKEQIDLYDFYSYVVLVHP